ncbi:hypothetical protein [Nonomuraea jiangxiensis]|uniref:hypothetical protein n=1 Tax=Nonomuraea jiangxiensis TaxID=633440 RepID=UPI00115F94EC|nr:hypothetical protein [Nonomuraea jiangxiensis]
MTTSIDTDLDGSPEPEIPPERPRARPGTTRRTRILALLLACAAGAAFVYLDLNYKPAASPEWKPGPFEPPVQYAFVPEDSACHDSMPTKPEGAEPELVTCTDWHLHVNYRRGEGKRELNIPYGVGCGGFDTDEDDCTSDIPLFDAASQVRTTAGELRGVPLAITPDGHSIAYFSNTWKRYLGWDLRTGKRTAISPPLDAKAFNDLLSVEVSPDGAFYALAFSGNRPRLLITESATGRTTTLPGFCQVFGVSRAAEVIAARRVCRENGTVTILDRRGSVTAEWPGGDFVGDLSPDGRMLPEVLTTFGEDGKEFLVLRAAETGEIVRKLELRLLSEPSDAIGHGWLDTDEYIVNAEAPEPGGGSFGYYRVNVRTGDSQRLRQLPLELGQAVSLGDVRKGR